MGRGGEKEEGKSIHDFGGEFFPQNINCGLCFYHLTVWQKEKRVQGRKKRKEGEGGKEIFHVFLGGTLYLFSCSFTRLKEGGGFQGGGKKGKVGRKGEASELPAAGSDVFDCYPRRAGTI